MSFSVASRDLSVFNLISLSFTVGMVVVDTWFEGSATLPSGTTTFPEGVVTFGDGGGVVPLLATVAPGVEPFVAGGTPADGFFARVLGFFGFEGGAGEVVVASAAGVLGAGVSVAGGVAGSGVV